jgi:hypothetical protein
MRLSGEVFAASRTFECDDEVQGRVADVRAHLHLPVHYRVA